MTFEDGQRFVREVVLKALKYAEMKGECAAAQMGISHSQFSRQLAGREHLSVQRLMQIDDPAFWFMFLAEFRKQFQVIDTTEPEIAHAVSELMLRIGRQVEGRHRMAKAALPDGMQERRRSA